MANGDASERVSIGTVSFGGVTWLISDEPTAKTRVSHRDTPLLLTVPNDSRPLRSWRGWRNYQKLESMGIETGQRF
jgi:hypothetical protein